MHGLAITYRKLKRYDDSITICQEILKLDSDYAKVYFNLGLVYEEQGEWEKDRLTSTIAETVKY